MTALSATYRPTTTFIAEKDQAMKESYLPPFNHWASGQSHFSLIAREDRQVVLFQTNRFVAKAEGYPSLDAFEKMVAIVRDLAKRFEIAEIASVLFHSIRTLSMKDLVTAREIFTKRFCSQRTLNLLTQDEYTDFGLVVERRLWPATGEFQKFPKPAVAKQYAKLLVSERAEIGPVSDKEIIERGQWIEFHRKAANELYRTEPVISPFAILADLKFEARRRQETEFLSVDVLWKFYDWARQQADDVWKKIEAEQTPWEH
jgi:hypothetical protein